MTGNGLTPPTLHSKPHFQAMVGLQQECDHLSMNHNTRKVTERQREKKQRNQCLRVRKNGRAGFCPSGRLPINRCLPSAFALQRLSPIIKPKSDFR